jgi:hypothetical protein
VKREIIGAQTGHFSWGALGKSVLVGAATGAAFGGLGKVFGAVGGRLASTGAGRFLSGVADRVASSGAGRVFSSVSGGVDAVLGSVRGFGASARGAADGLLSRGGGREVEAGVTDAAEGGEGAVCPVHSFAAATPVLLANGHVKPISQVAAGDKVSNTAPGKGKTETHTVKRVIVTHNDHAFVDLAIASVDAHGRPAGAGKLTTTDHHPFYVVNRAAFVEAAHLRPGDRLQEPGGQTAEVLTVHRYIATAVTYDLTINGLHTYYVQAGETLVLVHNCGSARFTADSSGEVQDNDPELDGAIGRLGERRLEAVESAGKRTRPGTLSEMQTTTPSGLIVVSYGRSGFEDEINSSLQSVYAEEDVPHGRCSEMDCLNKVLNMNLDPEGSVVTTMGLLSKRLGRSLDGELLNPCKACGRVLGRFGVSSTGAR